MSNATGAFGLLLASALLFVLGIRFTDTDSQARWLVILVALCGVPLSTLWALYAFKKEPQRSNRYFSLSVIASTSVLATIAILRLF